MIPNPGFENGFREVVIEEPEFWAGNVPNGWDPWFYRNKSVPHDPDNPNGYCAPEMNVISSVPPYLDPPRVYGGTYAFKLHTQWRIYDGGIYQPVTLPAGLWRPTMYAHAWSAQADDPHQSIQDGNVTFRLGLGPPEPLDPRISWGPWVTALDSYKRVLGPILEILEAVTLTLYLRAAALYPYRHLDSYIDSVDLEEVGVTECKGLPREPYSRTYNVIRQDATLERATEIFQIAWTYSRETVGGSDDDAGIGDLPDRSVKKWDVPEADWPEHLAFYDEHYPGARVEFLGHVLPPGPEPPDPEPEPDPDWKPKPYVTNRTRLAFHGVGDGGQTGDIFAPLIPYNAQPASSKILLSLGAAKDIRALDPGCVTIGRVINVPGFGQVEGFEYGGDTFSQAHWHMAAILQAFGPYKPWYSFIEVLNEQIPPDEQGAIQLARFYMQCMSIAQDNGYRLALFSLSTGTPEPWAWDAMAPTGVFEMAAAGGHAISLHEYDLLGIGGNLYRYRYPYNTHILPRQLDIPLYITEFNVDVKLAKDPEAMWALWMAYDAEISKDPYIGGAHIYTVGMADTDYNKTVYSLYPRFREYAKGVASG